MSSITSLITATDSHTVRHEHTIAGPDRAASLSTPAYLGERPRPGWVSGVVRASVPALIIGLWFAATSRGWVSQQFLASPSSVWKAFTEIWEDGKFTTYLGASVKRASLGLLFGVPVGLLLGVLSGLSRNGEETIDPTMQMFRAVPSLALIPLFIAWFGIDEKFKIVLIAVSAALPIYAYAYLGVRNVDRKVVEAARGFGLRGWRLSREVILPSALPNIFMALRICLVLSMTALIAAEGIGTDKGIGYLVLDARQYARTDYTMLCIVMYALIGLFFDLVIRVLERVAMPWRKYTTVRG